MKASTKILLKGMVPCLTVQAALLFLWFYLVSHFAWWSIPAGVIVGAAMLGVGVVTNEIAGYMGRAMKREKAEDEANEGTANG